MSTDYRLSFFYIWSRLLGNTERKYWYHSFIIHIVVVEEEWMMLYLHLHIAEMFVIYLYTLNGWQAFYSELSVLYPDNTRDFPYILLNIKRYVFSFSIGHYFHWKNNLFFTTLNRKYNKDIWCLLCNSLFTLQSSYIICRLY